MLAAVNENNEKGQETALAKPHTCRAIKVLFTISSSVCRFQAGKILTSHNVRMVITLVVETFNERTVILFGTSCCGA
jgi:hypothetical protein